jgi:hypothetical protein
VTWRRKLSRASGIGISGFSITRKSLQEKSRNSETRQPHNHYIGIGEHVSPHIGFRVLEGSVNKCNENHDIMIRDFPITIRLWAIGAREKDRCWKVRPSQGVNTKRCRGSVRRVNHDLVSVNFPTGKFPTGAGKRW